MMVVVMIILVVVVVLWLFSMDEVMVFMLMIVVLFVTFYPEIVFLNVSNYIFIRILIMMLYLTLVCVLMWYLHFMVGWL